ncbi:MAG: HEAT repeat domain-containing protein [Planctomycetia bacterium]|nr:HEAT repeat domain-containing protein [Planctomycetia bacterium]
MPNTTLAAIHRVLSHGEPVEREAAWFAVAEIGEKAATNEILDHLANALAIDGSDADGRATFAALTAAKRLGPCAATCPVLNQIANILCNPHGIFDHVYRRHPQIITQLGDVLRSMRTAAAEHPLLKRLLDALHLNALRELGLDERARHLAFHREWHEWEQVALSAVGALGEAAAASLATSQFLEEMAKRMNHTESRVVIRAVWAVDAIGATAGTPQILSAVIGLLHREDDDLKSAGLRLITKLGIYSATPDLLAALYKLLDHDNDKIRRAAAAIFGGLHATGIRAFRSNETFAATSVQELSQ